MVDIHDNNIRKDVLAIDDISLKTPSEVVAIVEAKEKAVAEATGRSATAAPLSLFKKGGKGPGQKNNNINYQHPKAPNRIFGPSGASNTGG